MTTDQTEVDRVINERLAKSIAALLVAVCIQNQQAAAQPSEPPEPMKTRKRKAVK